MSKGSFPAVRSELISLEPYGGEGSIMVKALTTGAKSRIVDKIVAKAKKEHRDISDANKIIQESPMEYALYSIQECILDAPGIDAEHPVLSLEVISNFPDALSNEILSVISELSQFPLAQEDGTAVKPEPSMPTDGE